MTLRNRGFALIEILVALAIMAIVTSVIWGSFRDTARLKRSLEATHDRYAQVRIAMGRITADLQAAYFSSHDDLLQPEKRTLFVGGGRSDVDDLRFTAFVHERLYRDADEADSAEVVYYGEPDPDDRRRLNLMRRETRRLGNEDPRRLPGETFVLCEDVVKLKFSFFDAVKNEWRDEWNTTSADGQPDTLPSKVRISLTVRDERGEPLSIVTQARVTLWHRLD